MVEGLQLLGMALEGGHQPLEVFYSREQFAAETAPRLLQDLLDAGGRPHPVNAGVMQTLSERDAPQGIMATFARFEAEIEPLLEATPPSLIVILDRLQDPGNLGTLIRTADAVAATAVILLEPCVDLFDPKTVRGSMGSIFSLPIAHTNHPPTLFERLRRNYRLTGADGKRGNPPWQADDTALRGNTALVLGNEARGLSSDLRSQLNHWTRLPMPGHTESLNVAAAGAVLMYQWFQQNG